MYAIIELKGKQFHVSPNQTIYADLIEDDCIGKTFNIEKVLLVSQDNNIQVGQPYVKGASVSLKVEKEVKGEKVIAFKYRHNKNSKSIKGHRQRFHKVLVEDITIA
jgi:large subunit ribosomal protein L21